MRFARPHSRRSITRTRVTRLVALLGAMMLVAAACGGDDKVATTAAPATTAAAATTAAPETTAAPVELVDLKVALIPIIGPMPAYVAKQQGIFEAHGLNVEIIAAANGPAIVAGVMAGEFDVGFAAMSVIANTFSQGLKVKTVAPVYFEKAPDNYVFGIVAVPGIDAITDLVGKTVAMEGFGTISELGVWARFSAVGVDPDDVNFVTMPIPEMEAAFAQGRIDAAMVVEPFITSIEENTDARVISQGALGAEVVGTDRVLISGFFVTEDTFADHGDVVASFVAALEEAVASIAADLDQALVDATEFVKVPLEVMQNITLPLWDVGVSPSDVQPFLDAGLATGLLTNPVNAADILP